MAQILPRTIHYYLYDYWKLYGDPRSENFFLVYYELYSPLTLLAVYFVFVTRIGPWLMQNRKPFQLKSALITYNLLMVCANVYFFVQIFRWYNYGLDMFDFDYPSQLNLVDFGESTSIDQTTITTMAKLHLGRLYLLSKFLDLFDTVFFVLRKKRQQVTKLHLYHHLTVPLFGWIVLRLVPTNGPIVIFVLLNSLIHVCMYSYYCLAAALAGGGPTIVQRYLWWKKYITMLQIVQFAIYAVFSALFACYQQGYPLLLQVIAYTQPSIFLALFVHFYMNSYGKTKGKTV